MVMTGYDTHEPLDQLLRALRESRPPTDVPNLWWKDGTGTIRHNGGSHHPRAFACGVDWSSQPEAPPAKGWPIREILAIQNAGCAHDCPWCGGSAATFRRIHQCDHSLAHKPVEEVRYELRSMAQRPGVEGHHYYAVGSYNQSESQLEAFLEGLARARVRSVSVEQFVLPSDDQVARLVAAHPRCTITLSPQSHDLAVAKAAGRGVYTNEELEAWLERALAAGIHGVDLWYFVGMPEQDERLVLESVDYCEHLLRRFAGTNVNPLICPMIPFLDPGSAIFEAPERYGYRLFFRTLEEHRRGMERASLINRLNYETRWLDREAIIRVGFEAVARLMEAKADVGMLPRSQVDRHNAALVDGLELLALVHEADNLSSPSERQRQLARLGDDIEKQNDQLLYGGVANQAFPLKRQPVGRWFDELCWPVEVLEATQSTS
ncbi:MAG: radical SAM protein [Deltaproteobacteria bacterium]|nr:radical SAM protein [Deltaproteobacteria bacterium]